MLLVKDFGKLLHTIAEEKNLSEDVFAQACRRQ